MADDALRSSIREALGEVETGTASGRPRAQLPLHEAPMNVPADPRTAAHETSQNRTLHMQLMPEALARVHMQERLQEAEHQRLLRAVALKRRAERASLRARRALASVVLSG
ncbi:hypothetical protein [Streptacidiphilus monticola]|uniref:Uncharacterized protein n=1 Tax=Streptacidiphilus monticola TaxID=2161674 RepID=A0ABW1G2D9_9ACTN